MGEAPEALRRRLGKGPGGRRGVPGAGEVAGDLRGIGPLVAQRGRQHLVQSGARGGRDAPGDDLGDQVVGHRPSVGPGVDELRPPQGVEVAEDDTRRSAHRQCQQAGRDGTAEERQQGEELASCERVAVDPGLDRRSLAPPGGFPGQGVGVRRSRDPAAVRAGSEGPPSGELPHQLRDGHRGAVGVLDDARDELRIRDRRAERPPGERAEIDPDQRPPQGGQALEVEARRPARGHLFGTDRQDQPHGGQPGGRPLEHGEAARVGPLQVVDRQQAVRSRSRRHEPDRPLQGQGPPALDVERTCGGRAQSGKLGHGLRQCLGRKLRKGICRLGVQRQAGTDQRPDDVPWLVTLRGRCPDREGRPPRACDRLCEQPRLAGAGGPGDQGSALAHREDGAQLGLPPDERQPAELPGGRSGRGRHGDPGLLAPQDPGLQLEGLGGRVQAQILGQLPPQPRKDLERAGGVARRRQGSRQHEVRRFPERCLRHREPCPGHRPSRHPGGERGCCCTLQGFEV